MPEEVKPLTEEEISWHRERARLPLTHKFLATLDERDAEIARITKERDKLLDDFELVESALDAAGVPKNGKREPRSIRYLTTVERVKALAKERDEARAQTRSLDQSAYERGLEEGRVAAFRECAEIANRIRRQIELSPGVGADRQAYGIAVCEDIVTHIKCACPEAFEEGRDANQ